MEPIAVVGYSFRLPQGAEDDTSFWDVLENGRNVMTPWPESRGNVDAFYHPDSSKSSTLRARGAHFLKEDPGAFDAPFFSITSKEASSMDPQQRWLLETSYRALENAGIAAERVAGTQTAVYAASMADDYLRIISKDPDEAPLNAATGSSPSILANRLSWYFDLKGPSIQLNTACSTSLIAVDLACQSLRSGQSSMALVAGSNVLLSVENSLYLSNMNFLSPDSVCYSFDHRANGYARGEGVVVMVLKRLVDAVRDGDILRAVIRATGSNQDGRTPGLTQPSADSQEALIRKVYQSCDLGFGLTRYIEAHGTGTQIGDQTEMKGIGRVFRTSRSSTEPLYVGSVKANVGHLEGCSGLTSILKCIMILEKGMIPPNALFERMNTGINAKLYKVQIPTSCIPWPTDGLRRVSVNSFGFGGSNGHVIMDDAYHTLQALGLKGYHQTAISLASRHPKTNGHTTNEHTTNGDLPNGKLVNGNPTNGTLTNGKLANGDSHETDKQIESLVEEPAKVSGNGVIHTCNGSSTKTTPITPDTAPATNGTAGSEASKPPGNYKVLVWSARDEAALKRMIKQYSNYCKSRISGSKEKLEQLAYTLSARRSIMSWRSFAIVDPDTADDLSTATLNSLRSYRDTGLAFIFTGQGAQYRQMGLELLQYPIFQSTLATAAKVFRELGAEWSVIEEIQSGSRIDNPEFSQPLCSVLQLALVELLKSFNIAPAAVVGHSSGEIAAAYTVGALSLESACKVAYYRGKLAGRLAASTSNPEAMMSVNLPEGGVQAYLGKVSLGGCVYTACVNSPSNVTLSGSEADIDTLKGYLDSDEIFAHKLKTGVAYHSPTMQQISAEYLACLGVLERGTPGNENILMVSSVTGEKVLPSTVSDGQYWVDNMVHPVRFSDALQYLVLAAPKVDGLKTISDYLEVGPHGALRRPVSDTLSHATGKKTSNYSSLLSKFDSPLKSVLETAGRLFARGYPISITAANQQDTAVGAPQFLVDTPEYPFDHSQTYWYESRLSREFRLRQPIPKSLLGTRATDWNPLQPRWRKMLSIEEIPWIADHIVGETAFFPATGTIMMALEAVKQTASAHQAISGYHIKEATFQNPIVVRPEGRTEVITQLRPLQQVYEKSSFRSEVRVFSCLENYWTECFKGIIHTEYEELSTEVDGGREARANAQALADRYEHAKEKCTNRISKQDFYKWHHDQGLKYGPAFSLADDIYWDGGELGVARVDVGPPYEPFLEAVVHPAALDASCQVCFTSPSDGMSKTLPTIIPHKMQDTWISATGWQYPDTRQIRMLTTSKLKPNGAGIESSFIALADNGTPLCHVKRLEMLPVVGNQAKSDGERKLLHSIDWKPQLSLLSPAQLRRYCDVDFFLNDETAMINYCTKLETTLRTVLQHKIGQLFETDWLAIAPHMRKYVSWMEMQLSKLAGRTRDEISEEDLNQELEDLREEKPAWRMSIEIAQNLVPIVRGEVDALELLFSTSLAQDYYDDFFSSIYNHKLISYLQLSAHQTPDQKILEVGSGTGGMTSLILSILRQVEDSTGGIAFSEYTYTDVSPAFFEKAQERFAEYQDRMTFKSLDLERDVIAQGFKPGSYDMIFAGSVLHATKNLAATLQNLRRALKPGGHLIFHETTAPDCFVMSFSFGILSGWWCSEEKFRTWGPTVTEPVWDRVLRENGFSGNDLVIRDYQDDAAHYASIIITTAEDPSRISVESSRVILAIDVQDEYQKSLASSLANGVFGSSAHRTEILDVTELANGKVTQTDYVVFLADMGKSLLAQASETLFKSIQSWVQQSKNLLWVTSSETSDSNSEPYPFSGIKDGLLRTLRSEFTTKRIISLSLEGETQDATSCINHISKVFESVFETGSAEVEYVVRDGYILTGRLVQQIDSNKALNSLIVPQTTTEPWLPGPPLKLTVGSRGSLETLHYVEDIDHYDELGPLDVEIEAKAWGVNFRDVFIALGRLDEDGFGSDCAGVVTRVGSQCSTVRAGDRVCMAVVGCMRMFPRAEERAIVKIPDSVSFEEACGIINPGITAWHSLVEVARLQKDEKVLIHAASGATGQLAIQVAKMVGAEVFATVGYDHKKQFLIDYYGIPEDHIFYSRNTSFAKGIMRVTNGYGVDVVLNSLVGEGLRASWECVAPYGRFVEIGKADIHANSSLPMACFANNVSFFAVDLRHISFHKKETGVRLLHKAMDLAGEGSIHCPQPLCAYEISAVEEAFRFIQSGKNTGRIVIKIDRSAKVQKHLIQTRSWSFDKDATYVVAGGLGGIGRSILKWMVEKGAKHLLVPSRSGVATKAAAEVVDALSRQGVTVSTPKCDISLSDSFSRVLEECGTTMPPIRGCINATMVLNDSVFDTMTHAQWQRTISSKVQSSWNLHTLLPKDLDFFVLLSSVAGIIGNPGQSNYAAGCTFQDALAKYRVQRQQKAISIDLGVMRTIGIVAETEALHRNFEGLLSIAQIEEKEFLSLLNIYCDPTLSLSPGNTHVTMGMGTPVDLLVRGLEPEEMMQRPLFGYFGQVPGISQSSNSASNDNAAVLFRQSESAEERANVVVESLAKKLARALSIQPEDVDADKPLHAFGVDSLVAVELRNWIAKEFAADVPVFEIMGGRTVAAIGELGILSEYLVGVLSKF